MNTLDRYISSLFLKNLAVALLGLVSFYLFQALMGELIDNKYPSSQIVFYNLMNLPFILVQMAPPSVMMATVMTLSGLNRTNELTAAFAIGVGIQRISLLLLGIVFMFSCLMLMMQDRVLPPVFKARNTYYWQEMKKRTDFFLDVKKDKIWYRSKNLIYNIRTFDPQTKMIHGMAVYTFDEDFGLAQFVEAEKAIFTPTGWRLMDGTVTIFAKDDQSPLTQTFKEKDLVIQETPKDFQEIEREVHGLRLKELREYINRSKASGANTRSYEVEYHSRISLAFIPLVMCILGVPFSVGNRRSGSAARDFGLSMAVTFFYWLFYSVGLSLGTNGALPPILGAWLPSVFFAGLAAFLLSRNYGQA